MTWHRSPFNKGMQFLTARYSSEAMSGSDISFVSSGRPSFERAFPTRSSYMPSDRSFESVQSPRRSVGAYSSGTGFSSLSHDSFSSEASVRAFPLHRWKMEEQQKLEEARLAGEAALALAAQEKAKCKAAVEAAEAAKQIAEFEAQKRMDAEMRVLKDSEERKKATECLPQADVKYRKYTIDELEVATEYFAESRKIGEGGYGPVYKCYLDHTQAAVKVLRPDAAQGKMQFQQEVWILNAAYEDGESCNEQRFECE
ncbi:hypothetical protein GW17_00022049 [Ensete ventricosum]|nr:hypothetical protein GW17_00022049 [Ensete ventricosum]RZS15876.1 hypothetical protein BHM03_00047777 [Ensete ventricosum]